MKKHMAWALLWVAGCPMEDVETDNSEAEPLERKPEVEEGTNVKCRVSRIFDGNPTLSFAEMLRGQTLGVWECDSFHLLIDTVRCYGEPEVMHDRGEVIPDHRAVKPDYAASVEAIRDFAKWQLALTYVIDRKATACLDDHGDLAEIVGLLRPTPYTEIAVVGDLRPRSQKLVEPPFYLGHDGPSIAYVAGWPSEVDQWQDLPSPSLVEFTAEVEDDPRLEYVAYTATGFEVPPEHTINGIPTPPAGVPRPSEPRGAVEIGADPSVDPDRVRGVKSLGR